MLFRSKFSYQLSTLKPENRLVKLARSRGVSHIPEIHACQDLWVVEDGARIVDEKLRGEMEKYVLERDGPSEGGKKAYEDRVFRAIAYTAYQSIRELFVEKWDLIPIMVDQMIDCELSPRSRFQLAHRGVTGLHELRYKAKILHRDVSVNNIMYEIRDGAYYFILIDFDMAIVVEDRRGKCTYQASSKHRTGTFPFMARELIDNANDRIDLPKLDLVPHLLRHDYESLFYVSFWSVTAIPPTMDIKKRALLARFANVLSGDSRTTVCTKQLFLTSCLKPALIEASPPAKDLCLWFIGFSTAFRKAVNALNDYECALQRPDKDDLAAIAAIKASFDFETVDGLLTRDTLKTAIAPDMPAKSIASMHVSPKYTGAESAPAVSVIGEQSGSASVTPSGTTAGRQKSKNIVQEHGARDERAIAHATQESRAFVGSRRLRRRGMTAVEAIAAQVYVDTKLRPRKAKV